MNRYRGTSVKAYPTEKCVDDSCLLYTTAVEYKLGMQENTLVAAAVEVHDPNSEDIALHDTWGGATSKEEPRNLFDIRGNIWSMWLDFDGDVMRVVTLERPPYSRGAGFLPVKSSISKEKSIHNFEFMAWEGSYEVKIGTNAYRFSPQKNAFVCYEVNGYKPENLPKPLSTNEVLAQLAEVLKIIPTVEE